MSALQKSIRKSKEKALESLRKNDLASAKSAYKKILKAMPNDAETWFMLGTVEGRQQNLDAAERCMRQAIAANAGLAEAWLGLGQVLELQNKSDEAFSSYLKAIELKPQLRDVHESLGRLYLLRQEFNDAANHYNAAVDLGVGRRSVFIGLGEAYSKIGRYADAREAYKQALAITDDDEVCNKLGNVCRHMGLSDEAIDFYQRSLAINPENIDSQIGIVLGLRDKKQINEAVARLRLLDERHGDDASVVFAYAKLCHLFDGCARAITKLEALLDHEVVSDQIALLANFELGRLYDAQQQYDDAFSHYAAGNRISRAGFDREYFAGLISDRIKTQSRAALTWMPRADDVKLKPIFIVGMPRSGTSLVEQILGCHPEIFPAGELLVIGDMASELSVDGVNYRLDQLDKATLDRFASQYMEQIKQNISTETCFSDKMPQNFLHLGLISLIFPEAKIIHCLRDPLDTCLSCYFQNFSGPHPYSHSLEDLGFYYRQYQRLMQHWKESLDLDIIDLVYEEMVENQEAQSRRLIDFLGLEWSNACLRFYESDRLVVTSSHDQVRRPVYTQSVSRWKNYTQFIAPLMAALQEELD